MKLQRLKELALANLELSEDVGIKYKAQMQEKANMTLAVIESYEELLAAAKGYLDNSVRDIGRQGRQAHGALLQAITNAEKLSQ